MISTNHTICICIHQNYIWIKANIMKHYISIFHTINLMFIIYFETSLECFVITPNIFSDEIELYNSSHDSKDHDLNTVKYNKYWLIYIDAILKKTLFAFLELWKILYTVKYGSAPSFQIMHYKMKKDCPVSDKLKPTNKPSRGIYYKEKGLADIKPDKHIIGRITISTAKCPKLLFFAANPIRIMGDCHKLQVSN